VIEHAAECPLKLRRIFQGLRRLLAYLTSIKEFDVNENHCIGSFSRHSGGSSYQRKCPTTKLPPERPPNYELWMLESKNQLASSNDLPQNPGCDGPHGRPVTLPSLIEPLRVFLTDGFQPLAHLCGHQRVPQISGSAPRGPPEREPKHHQTDKRTPSSIGQSPHLIRKHKLSLHGSRHSSQQSVKGQGCSTIE